MLPAVVSVSDPRWVDAGAVVVHSSHVWLPWDIFSGDQILLLCPQGTEVIEITYQIPMHFFLFFSFKLGLNFNAFSLVL